MPAIWSQDVTTNRIYNAKVGIFERIIKAGERRDEHDSCVAHALLDVTNRVLDWDGHLYSGLSEPAAIVLPVVEEALMLGANDLMHNRLSIEQNLVLALKALEA